MGRRQVETRGVCPLPSKQQAQSRHYRGRGQDKSPPVAVGRDEWAWHERRDYKQGNQRRWIAGAFDSRDGGEVSLRHGGRSRLGGAVWRGAAAVQIDPLGRSA